MNWKLFTLIVILLALCGCEAFQPVAPFPDEVKHLPDLLIARAERYAANQQNTRLAQARDLTAKIVEQIRSSFAAKLAALEASGKLSTADVLLEYDALNKAIEAARAEEAKRLAEYAATDADIENVIKGLQMIAEIVKNPGLTTDDYVSIVKSLYNIFAKEPLK